MTTKLNPGKPDEGALFSKGYKYRDGGPVSNACGDNQHEKCTLDFTKCNCHYRGLHKTPHVYATAPSPQPSAEATEPKAMSLLGQPAYDPRFIKDKWYPTVAGHAMRLRAAGELKAAAIWEEFAWDLYAL